MEDKKREGEGERRGKMTGREERREKRMKR